MNGEGEGGGAAIAIFLDAPTWRRSFTFKRRFESWPK